MKNKQAARQRYAAFALIALVLAVAAMDGRGAARADTDNPDFLVLNPERE